MKKITKCFLSLLGLISLGVGSTFVFENNIKETNADNVSFSEGTPIYLAGKGDIEVTGSYLCAWVWYTGGSSWEVFEYDDLSGQYMITLDGSSSGLTFARTEHGPSDVTNFDSVGEVYNKTDMNFQNQDNWIWPKEWGDKPFFTCVWKRITYHVAGSFSNPTWQGTDMNYVMNDGFDDKRNHQASFSLTTTNDNEEMKCTTNYGGNVPSENWYGNLAAGYNQNYIGIHDGNIVLKITGTYEIYLKSNRTVWVQISSATEADSYAQSFLSSITCDGLGNRMFDISNWNTVGDAQTSMEYKFSQLTIGAKNTLSGAVGSETGSNVEKCVARYDYILSKYGYGTETNMYHDFIGRKPSQSASLIKTISPFNENQSGTPIAVVVIVSVISLTAVGSYFFLQKRKED